MSELLSLEDLAWLRNKAVDGNTYSQVLLHLLERVEALEAAQQQPHQDKLDRLIALDRGDDEPTSEAAPVATDEELWSLWADRPFKPLSEVAALRAIYNLGRQLSAAPPPGALPARVLAMCQKRGWSLHWTSRGAYLHLEASELIEALRGKRGSNALAEAADVLLVLMSITENAGIPWAEVLSQTAATCARLEVCERYPGEEHDAQPAPMQRLIDAPMDARGYVDLREPAPPTAPAEGLVKKVAPYCAGMGDARSVIRHIAAWLDQQGQHGCSLLLREEAGR